MAHPAFSEMKASREAKLESMVGKRDAHHEHPSEKADRLAVNGDTDTSPQRFAPGGAVDDPQFTGQITDADRLDAGPGSAGYGINGGGYDYGSPASSIVGNLSKPMGTHIGNPMVRGNKKKSGDDD